MATTMFFEGPVTDKESKNQLPLEIGRSSYYGGENLIYINMGETGVILNEADGRKFCEAISNLASYLGYSR